MILGLAPDPFFLNTICADSVPVAVSDKVEEIFSFYIPASFSKNPASINRIFRAYGVGVKDFEFYVFNRWGDVVFQTTDLEKGWDGLIDGAPASDDVYVYFAKAYSASGKSISKSGTVTIID